MPAPRPSDAAILRAIAIWEKSGRGPWRMRVLQGEVVIEAEPPQPPLAGIGQGAQPVPLKGWKTG